MFPGAIIWYNEALNPKLLATGETWQVTVSADGEDMSGQQDSVDQEVLDSENDWTIEGIDQRLTPLQYHYLSLLQRLIETKNSYQTDPEFEAWMMSGINKSVYSTLRDCIESNVGDAAKDMLRETHSVN